MITPYEFVGEPLLTFAILHTLPEIKLFDTFSANLMQETSGSTAFHQAFRHFVSPAPVVHVTLP